MLNVVIINDFILNVVALSEAAVSLSRCETSRPYKLVDVILKSYFAHFS